MRRLLLFLVLSARLAAAQSSTGIWAPTTVLQVDGIGGFLDQATNVLWCSDFEPIVGITSATKMAWSAGSGANCSLAIYDAAGTTQIAVATGQVCNGGGTTYTGITGFSLTAGTVYRLCWCFTLGANGFYTNPTGSETMADVANAFVTHIGSAANSCTLGVPPATTGALTPLSIPPASVWISKE
jgi:hypothetical protein